MRTGTLMVMFLSFPLFMFGQKEYNIWCFGNKAGLDFNTPLPTILLTPAMSAPWGCSSISDTAGNLLFYTNGAAVWNREHQIMKNGNGLLGNPDANTSSLIVRQAFTKIYYIFTCDASNELPIINTGVHYSIVDMQGDSGRGEVIIKNRLLHFESAEKLAAVRHANNRDVWVVTGQIFSDTLHTYLLSDTGLSAPILNRNPGATLAGGNPGPMKFSPDGRKLAYMDAGYLNKDFVYLLDFNNRTGILSNPRKIDGILYGGSIEFSPDSRLLYIADWWNHYNSGGNYMLQTNISKVTSDVHYRQVSDSFLYPWGQMGALQVGPDGRLYKNGGYRLMVIENPNERAKDLRIYTNGPMITTRGHGFSDGFPAMVSSAILREPYLISRGRCAGDTVVLKVLKLEADSVIWNWGDGQRERMTGGEGRHVYGKSGNYLVTAIAWMDNMFDTVRLELEIMEIRKPLLPEDTILCEGESIVLRAGDPAYLSYRWNDDSATDTLRATSAGEYILTVKDRFCSARDTFRLAFGPPVRLFIGNDTTFCDLFSHVLHAGKPYNDYLWNTGDTTYSLEVNREGTYSLRVSDRYACSAIDTIQLEELKRPRMTENPDTQTCLFTKLTVERYPDARYRWSTGDTGVSTKVYSKGRYWIRQSTVFCSRTDTFTANILPSPDASLGSDTDLCYGSVLLRASDAGSYLWSTGDNGKSLYVYEPGTYTLSITRNGCTGSDTIVVRPCGEMKFYIPEVFSPDRNGINEVFTVYGEHITHVEMKIYSRWGELIYFNSGENVSWDGTFRSEDCQSDVYLYILKLTDLKNRSTFVRGTVHLLR